MDGLASAIDTCVAASGGESSISGDGGRGGCGRGSSSTSRLPLLASRGSGACRRRLRSEAGTLACPLSPPLAPPVSPLRPGDIPRGMARSRDGDAPMGGVPPPVELAGVARKAAAMLLLASLLSAGRGAGSCVRAAEAAFAAEAAAAACMATHEDVRSAAGSSRAAMDGACSTALVSVRLPPGPPPSRPAPGMPGCGCGAPPTLRSCTRAGPWRCLWSSPPSGRERRRSSPARPSGSPTSSSRNSVGGNACVSVGGRSTQADGRPPTRPLSSAGTGAGRWPAGAAPDGCGGKDASNDAAASVRRSAGGPASRDRKSVV